MKLLVTKTCVGVLDTDRERKRIAEAFKDDTETQKKLTELMDAIEALDWKKARNLLESKWWQGRDKEQECPRAEFLGMLNLKDPENPNHPARGFDTWAGYDELVFVMTEPINSKSYKVENV